MRKNKKGFTMAEVLVTLGILGVLAAILIPQIAKNIEKNKAGAILGRTVEQIELGCQNMIQKANDSYEDGSNAQLLGHINVKDLPTQYNYDSSLLRTSPSVFAEVIIPYFGLEKMEDVEKETIERIKKYDGSAFVGETGNPILDWAWALLQDADWKLAKKYKFTKTQASLYMPYLENLFEIFTTNPSNLDDENFSVTSLYIDINDKAKPNAFGRDVFLFTLTNSCKMVPYGLEDGDYYKNTCRDDYIKDGKSCSARVVADRYKINY